MSRKAPWQNNERHYCAICNAWMGSDRQSILVHVNGKKHQENAVKQQEDRRVEKQRQEQQQSLIQRSLRQMEEAARQSIAQDLGRYASSANAQFATPLLPGPGGPLNSGSSHPSPVGSTSYQAQPLPPVESAPNPVPSAKQEKKEWEARKRERTDHKSQGSDTEDGAHAGSKRRKLRLAPGEGFYCRDSKTYLEGVPFGDILEPDMPVQLWTGPLLANDTEKQLPEREMYWKNALVVAVRQRSSAEQLGDRLVVDVAYLQTPDDTQETVDKSVPLNRVRIELGADPSIPDNIEEARLLAMGGEEVIVKHDDAPEIDEATGLSSWTTVKVKRTTIRQEVKEERERLREQRKQAALEEAKRAKEAEERRMEEAKVANADDSALGAFDIWSRTKEGYKGVSIHEEAKVEVHELGKKLSDGKTAVAFKKRDPKSFKKQGRRTTSADDD